MKRKTSTDLFYTKLVQDLIDRVPIKEEGTTRGSDPTAYSKGEIYFMKGNCKFKIEINNFWGTKIYIYRIIEEQCNIEDCVDVNFDNVTYNKDNDTLINTRRVLTADLYLDRVYDRKKGHYLNEITTWKRNKGVLKLMYEFVKTHEVWVPEYLKEGYEPDPMGCLADYE